jgi:hypothetical protein
MSQDVKEAKKQWVMRKKAFFSPCGKYRYQLYRIWDESKPLAMCIGLNPSTANSADNDPTITRLIGILTDAGYGGFHMMNLYGLISPNPEDLTAHPDPDGENRKWVFAIRDLCQDVIFCWGNFQQAEHRGKKMAAKYPEGLCFGKNKNGSPKHPLYLPKTVTLKPYNQ